MFCPLQHEKSDIKYQRCVPCIAFCELVTSEESQGQLQLIVGVSPQLAEGGRG